MSLSSALAYRLEFAATAAAKGCDVQVVEVAPRVMVRAVSKAISDFMQRRIAASAYICIWASAPQALEGAGEGRAAVGGFDAACRPNWCWLASAFRQRETRAAAGLAVENGIVVDEAMTTSDPAISAIGDCAAHVNVFAGRRIRLESVQNASDQARLLPRRSRARLPVRRPAMVLSDQGRPETSDRRPCRRMRHVRDARRPVRTQLFRVRFSAGKLRVVESVNRAADHMTPAA